MKKINLALIAFLLLLSACTANQKSHSKYPLLDEYLNVIEKNQKGMGEVFLMHGQDVVVERSYGHIQAPEKALYRIGSITKIYTATIILKLVEEGKLKLSDKLAKFYPKLPSAKKITIEHLLRHRSGLHNFTDLPEYPAFSQTEFSEQNHLSLYKKLKIDFKPGSKYSYSNTGYTLLTFIAQKVSGTKYEQLLSQYITNPLQLKNTYVFQQMKPSAQEVKSYFWTTEWEPATNTHESIPQGAGAIVSTPHEVAIFLRSLLQGKIISNKSLELMKRQQDKYGLGLLTFPYKDKVAYGHTGGIDGFRSIAGYFPQDDLTFVSVTNGMDTNFNDISIAVLASYHGDEVKLPEFKPPMLIDSQILQKYVGTYSAPTFPLKISFFEKEGQLLAQATGQSAFTLEAVSNEAFIFTSAQIRMIFKDDGKTLEFTQGKTFILKKE